MKERKKRASERRKKDRWWGRGLEENVTISVVVNEGVRGI